MRKPAPVPREPYTGEVFDLATEMANAHVSDSTAPAPAADPSNIHLRGKTSGGGRNLQVRQYVWLATICWLLQSRTTTYKPTFKEKCEPYVAQYRSS